MSPRTGRRGGDSRTRDDIRDAARELFARHGFDGTSLRAIAGHAGVDVALIPYYFTNKRGLFVAAMALPIDPAELVSAAAAGPRDQLGTRIAMTFLTTWEGETTGPPLRAFLRSAVTDEATAQSFGEFLSAEMLPVAADQFGIGTDTVRAVGGLLFGIATMRYLIGAPAFTAQSADELCASVGPQLQAIIDQPH